MSSTSRPVDRRSFLKTSAAVAGAFAAPYFVPQRAFGANERIVTGHIGTGNRGLQNLQPFMDNAGALCDVDTRHLAAAIKLVDEKQSRKVEGYGDYRQMLDRKDIDAIVVVTPDHWHALQTIHACQAGKDVYCEKPLSLTIVEGRKMVEAARKHNRIVQTGSQQRSDDRFRLACELVRSGRIGKLATVLVGIPDVNFSGPSVPDSAPPPELDYNMWLGPAPERPFNEKRVHYLFRFFWDYSGGQMTNFGAHHLDIAQWGMGADETGPVECEGTAKFHPEGWYESPMSSRVTFRYADGVTVLLGQGQSDVPQGVTFVGSQGRIFVDRRKITSTPEEIVRQPLAAGDVHLYASKDHHQNFLECVKSRKPPICDVEIGHRSATVCHLGNITLRLGRKIHWDPKSEKIVGDADAAGWVQRPYRSPWTLG